MPAIRAHGALLQVDAWFPGSPGQKEGRRAACETRTLPRGGNAKDSSHDSLRGGLFGVAPADQAPGNQLML
ncbi:MULTISPECIES: hypothetical protein [Pseudomonadaceae]|uniref:Uncharacterized protein n=1 Tax=Pseudomonas denitrificans TaxID=43306 RepID=A0A9X7N0V8_PSEDE|nr:MULTISPECIES: hypothetical protein [Pseudomonadaceae]MBD9630832.1 hypothetical protein [Pseudomonas sp. PDM19]MBD9681540.1 hypothetical protein [Pseudomonas sp. PDM20]QEY72904.1 hypothetical protein F1C79_15555 [Pseudomonas denitrificans (nom. rej.)]